MSMLDSEVTYIQRKFSLPPGGVKALWSKDERVEKRELVRDLCSEKKQRREST